MRIAIASDHAAVELRQQIVEHLRSTGHEVADCGSDPGVRVDYPDYAAEVGRSVAGAFADCGILVCGTGIGMSIAANKVDGVRAALVHDVTTARLAAQHNNANVLCLGGRVLGPVTVIACIEAWLDTDFEARHQARLDKITALESE
jgi:ribose 5-phosphate isomerase B